MRPGGRCFSPSMKKQGVEPGASGGLVRRPFDEAMCEAVEEVRPELVSFHFGLPDEALLARVRRTGAKMIGNATTVAEARALAARGVDAIIAQGWEAGGHAGRFLADPPDEQMGLLALLPQIVDAVSVPVIAAGGIGDARGIAAAFLLGATAVQLGTAYLHCPESLIGPEHRAGLTGEAAEHTAFTNLYSGGLARGLPTPADRRARADPRGGAAFPAGQPRAGAARPQAHAGPGRPRGSAGRRRPRR